ncbi:MAG: BON domain-containing protein [Pseudomonadota bacterium]
MKQISKMLLLIVASTSVGLLAGCNRNASDTLSSQNGATSDQSTAQSPATTGTAANGTAQSGATPPADTSSSGNSGIGTSGTGSSGASGTSPVADTAVTAKVKTAIIAEPGLKSMQITVDTKDGIVTLSGSVDNPQNVQRAAQVAQAVTGVKSVVNQLTVKAPA